MNLVSKTYAALAFLVLLSAGGGSTASGSATKTPPPGVSLLTYSPKPFHRSRYPTPMRVELTTTGPAGQGRKYRVWLLTGLDDRDEDCIEPFQATELERHIRDEQGYERVLPVRGQGHFVLVTHRFSDRDIEAPACFGRARLEVWTTPFRAWQPARLMRRLTFEILPPRSS